MLKIGVCGTHSIPEKEDGGLAEVVELSETYRALPSVRVLARWRAEAHPSLEFVPTVPRELANPEGSETLSDPFHPLDAALDFWERLLVAADILEAKTLLMTTDHLFRPTRGNRSRMSRFFERCSRSRLAVVWRPEGVWTDLEVESVCRELELRTALDPLENSGRWGSLDWAYGRVEGLGTAGRPLDADEVEQLALRCFGVPQGYMVLATAHRMQDLRNLARRIGTTSAPEGGQDH